MNLQHLKWTKNVKPKGDEPWAYKQFGVGSLFKLAWRDGEANASKPQREDLILLRQKGFATHLVKVLDYKPERETGQGEFDIYFGSLPGITRLCRQKQMKFSDIQKF